MRIVVGLATLLLLAAAGSADAGWFSNTRKLPKAIDTPVVRPKVQEHHKALKKQRHPNPHSQIAVPTTTANA